MDAPVDLRSDFLTRPTPAMQAAMAAAAAAPAHFGLREDPRQQALERRAADLLGMEDALLFPTCTMANEVALMLLTTPGDLVLAPPRPHVVTSEAGAPAALAGVAVVELFEITRGDPGGVFAHGEVARAAPDQLAVDIDVEQTADGFAHVVERGGNAAELQSIHHAVGIEEAHHGHAADP